MQKNDKPKTTGCQIVLNFVSPPQMITDLVLSHIQLTNMEFCDDNVKNSSTQKGPYNMYIYAYEKELQCADSTSEIPETAARQPGTIQNKGGMNSAIPIVHHWRRSQPKLVSPPHEPPQEDNKTKNDRQAKVQSRTLVTKSIKTPNLDTNNAIETITDTMGVDSDNANYNESNPDLCIVTTQRGVNGNVVNEGRSISQNHGDDKGISTNDDKDS